MNVVAFLTALFLALVTMAPAGWSQAPNCGPRDAIIAELQGRYGESVRNMGLDQNNAIVEVYASDATGTWTIVVTTAAGMSCLVAAGEGWEMVVADAGDQGDPA